MKNNDLTTILTKEHEKKWVALSKDNSKVIAYHASLVELDKQVAGQDVVFMKVPPSEPFLSFSVKSVLFTHKAGLSLCEASSGLAR